MVLNIDLTADQEQRLRKQAEERGVDYRAWVQDAFTKWLDELDDREFDEIVDRVLARNHELYKRLA